MKVKTFTKASSSVKLVVVLLRDLSLRLGLKDSESELVNVADSRLW